MLERLRHVRVARFQFGCISTSTWTPGQDCSVLSRFHRRGTQTSNTPSFRIGQEAVFLRVLMRLNVPFTFPRRGSRGQAPILPVQSNPPVRRPPSGWAPRAAGPEMRTGGQGIYFGGDSRKRRPERTVGRGEETNRERQWPRAAGPTPGTSGHLEPEPRPAEGCESRGFPASLVLSAEGCAQGPRPWCPAHSCSGRLGRSGRHLLVEAGGRWEGHRCDHQSP